MKVKIRKYKLVRTRYGSTARRLRLAYVINEKQCHVFIASKRSRKQVVNQLSCLRCLNIAREGDNVSRRKIVGGCLVDSPEMDHLAGCCPHNADKYLLFKDREKKKPRIVCYSSHPLKKMLVFKESRTHGYLFDKYKVNRGHEMALCIGCKRENSRRPTITQETAVRGAVSGNTLLFDPRRGHISGCKPLPIDEIRTIVMPNRRIKQEIIAGRYMTTTGAVVHGQPPNETVNDHSVSLEHGDPCMDDVEASVSAAVDYNCEVVGTHYEPVADDTNISNDGNVVSLNNFDAAETMPALSVISSGLNDAVVANFDGFAEATCEENLATNVGPTGDDNSRSDTTALVSHDDSNEFVVVSPEVSHHTRSFSHEEFEDGELTPCENGPSDDERSFDGNCGLETMDVDVTPPRVFGPANYDHWHDARPKVKPRSKSPEVITISDDENNGSPSDQEGTIVLSSDDEDMEIACYFIQQQEARMKAFERRNIESKSFHVTTFAANKEAPEVGQTICITSTAVHQAKEIMTGCIENGEIAKNRPFSDMGQAELPTEESMNMDLSGPGDAISAQQTEVADTENIEESQSAVAEKGYFFEEQLLALGAVVHNKTMDIDSAINGAALKELDYQAVNGEGGVCTPPLMENDCAHPKFVDAQLNNEESIHDELMSFVHTSSPTPLPPPLPSSTASVRRPQEAEIACGYVADEEMETRLVLEKHSGEVDQVERTQEIVIGTSTPASSSVHRMVTRSKDCNKRKVTNSRNQMKLGHEQPVAKLTVLHDSVVSTADSPLAHSFICHKTMRMQDNEEANRVSNAKKAKQRGNLVNRSCRGKSAKLDADGESSNGSQTPSDDTDDEEYKSHVSIQQHFRRANIRFKQSIQSIHRQFCAVDPSTISLFDDGTITERREVLVIPRYSPKLLKNSTWVRPSNRQLLLQDIQEDTARPLVKLVDILKPLVDAMNPANMEREFAVFDNLPMPELGENDSLSDLDLFSLDDEERAWFENLVNNTDLENQYFEDGEENDLFGPYHH